MDLSDGIDIRGRRFNNRTVMAPMVPNMADVDGAVTSEYQHFYEARAQGGVGFLILGAAYVHPDGQGFDRQLGIHDDRLLPGLTSLAASLQVHTRVGVQLSFKSPDRLPETFSRSEMDTYRQAFADAALRARDAGFDAVELHACHDYWLNFFLSPHFNHRNDAYGGSLQRRARLLEETVEAVRKKIGAELLLGVRLSMDEFVEDGLKIDDTLHIASRLEAAGVDYISASGGIGATQYRMSPPMEVARGSLLHLSRALKQMLRIPVIGVGRLDRPFIWREAVSDGHADMAAVARGLIADPDYAAKTLAHRDDEIRPCVACNFCLYCLHKRESVKCAVNPYVGRDALRLPPVDRPLNVVVVGGGPAGLSCAVESARRGAQVCLYEAKNDLGGVVAIGQRPPFKTVLQDFITYLVNCAKNQGVDIRMGINATAALLRSLSPDRLVLATGADPIQLPLPGLQNGSSIFTAEQVLGADSVPPGRFMVVGGGAVGLETAEYLSQFAAAVTVVEMTLTLGQGMHATRLSRLLARLGDSGVRIASNTKIQAVEGDRVQVKTNGKTKWMGPYDYIVFAVGSKSNRTLARELSGEIPLTVIGDALQPRSIYEAVSEGLDAALNL